MAHINFSRANCKNCYKCLRSCPVKAVKFSNQQAEIVEERCIKCGHCLYNCPQNASYIQSDLYKVKEEIKNGRKVIASIDPSLSAYFQAPLNNVVAAIKELGFKEVEESSVGIAAMDATIQSYIKDSSQRILISTSCPSTSYLVEKYYPELIECLIPLDSPMIAHGKILKDLYGEESFVVFIGPCVSRKFEAGESNNHRFINAVLTFDEIQRWIHGNNINIDEIIGEPCRIYNPKIGFHAGEGPSGMLCSIVEKKGMELVSVDGINHCMEIFQEVKDKKLENVFLKVSACRGNCIGGPDVVKNSKDFFSRQRMFKKYLKERRYNIIKPINKDIDFSKRFYDKGSFKQEITIENIDKAMKLLGKYELRDELNCGVCGYSTCREKAKAVCLGMAEVDMCLNFMRSKSENITNVIFKNSPSIIMIIDEDMCLVEINPAAEEVFKLKSENVKGKKVSLVLDEEELIKVRETKTNILGRRLECPEYNGIFIQNILYLEKHNIILVTMNNIMEMEKNKAELMNVKESTLNAAQEIIGKQMRVAQEIASLLGETTAETKVTITNLKKLVQGN